MINNSKGMTCAVFLESKKTHKFLICRATGTKYWSMPKGLFDIEIDDFPDDAAVRELQEETGIVIDEQILTYIGTYIYTKEKDLIIYYCQIEDEIPIESLTCESTFTSHYTKKQLPEVDKYKWTDLDNIINFINPRQCNVLLSIDFQNSLKETIKKVEEEINY